MAQATDRKGPIGGCTLAAAVAVFLIFLPAGACPEDGEGEVPACPCGLVLCAGHCLAVDSNVNHCGGCGTACATDQACVDGECRSLCNPREVSTKAELLAELRSLDWVSTPDQMRYLTVTEELEVVASDLGPGYIFVSDVDGVSLDADIVYGFDLTIPGTYCGPGSTQAEHPAYPSVGHERMLLVPGTSFVAERRVFVPNDAYGACPDGVYCDFWNAGGHFYHCCCSSEPFDWTILTLREIPVVCRDGLPACATDFAGSDHSWCYDGYDEYVAQGWPHVHERCIDPATGYALPGRACTCTNVCDGDMAEETGGTCNECGRCDMASSCPYGGILTEPDARCD